MVHNLVLFHVRPIGTLLQGGSWISTGDEASRFARFAFRRHFLQHAGFRVARTVQKRSEKINLPARIMDTEMYVLGSGVEGKYTRLVKPYHYIMYE